MADRMVDPGKIRSMRKTFDVVDLLEFYFFTVREFRGNEYNIHRNWKLDALVMTISRYIDSQSCSRFRF